MRGGVLLASLLIVTPVQASTLSQSQTVTVTGGHFYTYTYWQEVQTGTGTQQVQMGTTTEWVGFSTTVPTGGVLIEQKCWGNVQPPGAYCAWGLGYMYFEYSVPAYTTVTVPVYTNEEFTGTAWSPATITYS